MPRLQIARRASLLSTNLRAVFLEAFGRNVSTNIQLGVRRVSGTIELHAVARRVQTEIRQATGRYCPLHQVISSIHDLEYDRAGSSAGSTNSTQPPTPRPVSIIITPTAQSPPETFTVESDSSMPRRRIARNIPALQCQLSMPHPPVPLTSSLAPSSPFSPTPTCMIAPVSLPRRSPSSYKENVYPITPVDQIVHTPLTPPKLPRLFPPAPRTWAHLNAEARKDELSPVGTPTLPLTPYLLGPTNAGKPILGRLHIPDATGDSTSFGAQSNPSPQTLSPLDLGKPYLPGIVSPTLEGARPVPGRTDSSSNLTRTALLRATRPAFVRSFSQTLGHGVSSERAGSPLSPFASSALVSPLGQPLASPFTIRPEAVRGEYFCV